MMAVALGGCGTDKNTAAVRRQIQSDLKRRDMPDDAPWRDRRTQSLVRAFYAERKMHPAWTHGAGVLNQARELADVLAGAADEGLNPDDYSAPELAARLKENEGHLFAKGDPKTLAEFDLLCTIAAFHYMSDVSEGRISPKALDAEWVARPRRGDIDSLLAEAVKRNRVKATLSALAPQHTGYQRLRAARARYRQIVESGGWPAIPAGGPLKKGQTGRRVEMLRARLVASGDLDSTTGRPSLFDDALEAAVRRVEFRFGRKPDGIVSAAEIADLNVPADYRLRQIELNMERWRWAPKTFEPRYLMVNIPEYALHVYERGRDVLAMRVVVGKAMTATPVFSDVMTQVVANPTWGVPMSIIQGEFPELIREDPNYLAKNRIRVFDREAGESVEVSARSIDWSDSSETRRLAVRQDAGEQNALGRIKFLLPNQFDVYLHDTPQGHLFAKEERSFSHGCIRVENPMALAEYVLRGTPEGDAAAIETIIASDSTRTLKIPEPLPVHVVYFTAFVEDNGAVGFREDVYGIDQNLIEELRGRERARARQA